MYMNAVQHAFAHNIRTIVNWANNQKPNFHGFFFSQNPLGNFYFCRFFLRLSATESGWRECSGNVYMYLQFSIDHVRFYSFFLSAAAAPATKSSTSIAVALQLVPSIVLLSVCIRTFTLWLWSVSFLQLV